MKIKIFDKVELKDKKVIDEFGLVHYKDIVIARTGTQDYLGYEIGLNSNEIVKVYRTDEEVKKSINTIDGKPITINHTDDYFSTDSEYEAIGTAYNTRFKDGKVIADLIFYKNPPKELGEISLGYSTSIIEKDGKYYQSDITVNHIALVNKARCGSLCSLKDNEVVKTSSDRVKLVGIKDSNISLDKKSKVKIKDENKFKGDLTMKIKLNDKVFEVDEAVAGHIEALDKKVEELKKEATKAYDRAVEELTSKAKYIKLAKDRKIAVDDSKELKEIKRAVAKGLGYNVENKSDDYITAILDVESTKSVEQKEVKKDVMAIDWDKIAEAEL